MSTIEKLHEMRAFGGPVRTTGLPDSAIAAFLASDPALGTAIDAAHTRHQTLRASQPELLGMPEGELIVALQHDYVNFYQPEAVNPYVPLSARGPWIVTSHGAVLHDNGGYGMLGGGHAPSVVLDAMGQAQVMANIMTASFSQQAFSSRLRREVGHSRDGGCPFHRFLCLNSGSESMTVARRLADVNAAHMTGDGGPREGARVAAVVFEQSFHGRTDGPARISHSSAKAYNRHLASFQEQGDLLPLAHNDVQALEDTFAHAERFGVFIEAVYFEPAQGEGNPGRLVSREWYDAARRLTRAHGALLVADSIQAGIRATGALSIVDYPGFEDADPPDIESWSKALNAGQYPLSVLGLSERAAALYRNGIYGNTMTTNPRALDVACAVLDGVTPALRRNIRDRGVEFQEKLNVLRETFPDIVESVQGSGLLFCAELHAHVPVVGFGAVEEVCRQRGLGVIHGGKNALRFTPHFGVSSAEIDLVVDVLGTIFAEMQAEKRAASK
jgi:acetylornithine/succinyldiaminopimelate/putrescine aminotransferase